MDHSPTYRQLITMIEKNWLVKSISEFEQQLGQLEQEEWISAEEKAALLELYAKKISGNK